MWVFDLLQGRLGFEGEYEPSKENRISTQSCYSSTMCFLKLGLTATSHAT